MLPIDGFTFAMAADRAIVNATTINENLTNKSENKALSNFRNSNLGMLICTQYIELIVYDILDSYMYLCMTRICI